MMPDPFVDPSDCSHNLLQLPLDERKSLTILAVLTTPFGQQEATDFLPPGSPLTLEHWQELGLLHVQGTDAQGHPWFLVDAAVQQELLKRVSASKRKVLHLHAADYYGRTFLNEAHRVLAARSQTPTEEKTAALAWGEGGFCNPWTNQFRKPRLGVGPWNKDWSGDGTCWREGMRRKPVKLATR
ncbi:MAG: hypothetical protein R3F37_14810 [Candidatus Competibacteraceae bacterium]